jgi:long-chain fatty acid transport protein
VAIAIGAATGASMLPRTAHAGGFEIPDHGARALGRGGAVAAGVNDGTAIHYNPGALALQKGTRLYINNNVTFERASLDGAVWDLVDSNGDPIARYDFEPVRNANRVFPLGAFAVLSSDFGLKNWTFALGVHGPHAVGRMDYPRYGPQSYIMTDLDVVLAYYSAAVGWKWQDKAGKDRLGIGATVQYADLVRLDYGLISDATFATGSDPSTFTPIPDEAAPTLLETTLRLKDRTSFTGNLGIWARPIDRLELGLAGRVVPAVFKPEGTLESDKDTLDTSGVRATMKRLVIPASVRVGARWIFQKAGREIADLELNVQYENWSQNRSYDIDFGNSLLSGLPLQPISIKKMWKDVVSVRLGSDFEVVPHHLTLRAGGLYESAAVDERYQNLDFPSTHRGGISAGLTGTFRGAAITVGYMHLFQKTTSTSEAFGRLYQQRPLFPCPTNCGDLSGVVANAGRIKSSYDVLGVSVEMRFHEWGKKGKARYEASRAPVADPSAQGPSTPAPGAAPVPAAAATVDASPTPDPTPDPTDAADAADATVAPEATPGPAAASSEASEPTGADEAPAGSAAGPGAVTVGTPNPER